MDTRANSSWWVFYIFIFGVVVLMYGVRPGLQPSLRQPDAPGPWIQLVGHVITWSAATFLTTRLVVSTRSLLRGGEPPGGV